jgi:predicted nuclease with TOPRIM domain
MIIDTTIGVSAVIAVLGAVASYGAMRQALSEAREKVKELCDRVKLLEAERVTNEGRWSKVEAKMDSVMATLSEIKDRIMRNE